MGRSILLYSSAAIEPGEFIRFVVEAGGRITDEEMIRGQISSGDCHVWLYMLRDQLAGRFEEPEEGVVTKLKAPVKACVDLQLSHHKGSGSLALEFSSRFVQRWPGVATCAAYDVLTAADVERLLEEPRSLSILSAEIKVLLSTPSNLAGMLDGLGGITIDASDDDMVASTRRDLGVIEGAHFDPCQDQVLGFVPSENSRVWLLRSMLTASGEATASSLAERLISIATRHLGTRPSCMIRIMTGYGASSDSERVAFVISERVLRFSPGVVIGIFERTLDAGEISNLIESGRGLFIA
jgi:hypothetical protein